MRRIVTIFITVLLLLVSCQTDGTMTRFSVDIYDAFDTVTIFTAYVDKQKTFDEFSFIVTEYLKEMNVLFDIYNNYDGINNLKTVNDNAGIAPVTVDIKLIDLLIKSKEAYKLTGGAVNVALGAVLSLWHEYREAGISDENNAELPPMELLSERQKLCNIDSLIIDEKNNTVYLSEKGMSVDAGAVAKGYATALIAEELIQLGLESFIINMGGNVQTHGKPLDGVRNGWRVGIESPFADEPEFLDEVQVNNTALVTSGDYQRFYTVDGKRYCHIIDPKTLMPAENLASVTILTDDAFLGDVLSTAFFILPEEEGKKLLTAVPTDAVWVKADKSYYCTEGYKKYSKVLFTK